jgi:hypothetical protein
MIGFVIAAIVKRRLPAISDWQFPKRAEASEEGGLCYG